MSSPKFLIGDPEIILFWIPSQARNDKKKKMNIEAKGWVVGNADDFLELSPEESRYVELKFALCDSLKAERLKQ